MADMSAPQYERKAFAEMSPRTVIIISAVFHILVLVGLPLLSRWLTKPKPFERPHTFQLVQLPPTPPPPKRRVPVEQPPEPVQEEVKPPEPEPKPTPKPEPPKPKEKPKEQPKRQPPPKEEPVRKEVEEDLSDLESLFDTPIPPVEAAVMQGDFKFPWYIQNIINKIQREWKPPTEDKNVVVEVMFTVHPDGAASNIRVSKSSGNSTLDNLAIRAVTVASPFGKMPPGFAGDKIEIRSSIRPTRR